MAVAEGFETYFVPAATCCSLADVQKHITVIQPKYL